MVFTSCRASSIGHGPNSFSRSRFQGRGSQFINFLNVTDIDQGSRTRESMMVALAASSASASD